MDYTFLLDWDSGPMCTTTYHLKQLIGKESDDIEKTLYHLQQYGMKLSKWDQLNTYGDINDDTEEYISSLKQLNQTIK